MSDDCIFAHFRNMKKHNPSTLYIEYRTSMYTICSGVSIFAHLRFLLNRTMAYHNIRQHSEVIAV